MSSFVGSMIDRRRDERLKVGLSFVFRRVPVGSLRREGTSPVSTACGNLGDVVVQSIVNYVLS